MPAPKLRKPAAAKSRADGRKSSKGKGNGEKDPAAKTAWWAGTNGYLAVFALSVGLHVNTLANGFVYDDARGVVSNNDVIEKNPFSQLWINDFWGKPMSRYQSHKSYRPLTILTFRLNHMIAGGLEPYGFHVVNVAIHALVCTLFFKVATRVVGQAEVGLVAALLFTTHSIHTECVANIVGRAELLGGLFFLLSMELYCVACNGGGQMIPLLGSMIFAACAMLCKEQGLMVLGVVAAYDVIVVHQSNPFDIFARLRSSGLLRARFGAIAATGAGLLAIRLQMMAGGNPIFNEHELPATACEDHLPRWLTFNYYTAFNLQLLVAPTTQSSDWSYGTIPLIQSFTDIRCGTIAIAYTTVVAVATMFLKQMPRRAAFANLDEAKAMKVAASTSSGAALATAGGGLVGLAWMAVSYLPSSNLFFYVGFVVAERILYLPSMGYCIVLACLFRDGFKRIPKLTGVIFVAVLILLSARTIERNAVWRSDFTLHEVGAREIPQNIKLVTNYGMLLHEQAKDERKSAEERKRLTEETERIYQKGMADIGDVKFPNLYFTYGNLLQETGRLEDALKVYEEGIRRKDHTRTTLNLLNNMGMLHYKLKNYDAAEKAFVSCIGIDEDHHTAHNGLAVLYATMGRSEDAEAAFVRVLKLKPSYIEARFNYGTMLAQIDTRIDDAEMEFNKVLAVNPSHTGAKSNLKYVAHVKAKAVKKEQEDSKPAGKIVKGTIKR